MIRRYVFEIGTKYFTLDGNVVTIQSRTDEDTRYHTVFGDDGLHRYASRDFGRVVGSYANDPKNLVPQMSEYALGIQRTIIHFEEKMMAILRQGYRPPNSYERLRNLEEVIIALQRMQGYGPNNPNELTPSNREPSLSSLNQSLHAERFMFDGIHPSFPVDMVAYENIIQNVPDFFRDSPVEYRRAVPTRPTPVNVDAGIAFFGDSRSQEEDLRERGFLSPSVPQQE